MRSTPQRGRDPPRPPHQLISVRSLFSRREVLASSSCASRRPSSRRERPRRCTVRISGGGSGRLATALRPPPRLGFYKINVGNESRKGSVIKAKTERSVSPLNWTAAIGGSGAEVDWAMVGALMEIILSYFATIPTYRLIKGAPAPVWSNFFTWGAASEGRPSCVRDLSKESSPGTFVVLSTYRVAYIGIRKRRKVGWYCSVKRVRS